MVLMSEHTALMEKVDASKEKKPEAIKASPPAKPPKVPKAPPMPERLPPEKPAKSLGKTQERPEKKEGFYFKPSLGKNVARVTILGLSSCSAIRGMGRAGFTVAQAVKVADHFRANLNPRTVASHIRLGKENSDRYGSIPTLSQAQKVDAAKICGSPGVEKAKKAESKVVKKPAAVSEDVARVRQAVA